jgi:hypothetical protein
MHDYLHLKLHEARHADLTRVDGRRRARAARPERLQRHDPAPARVRLRFVPWRAA